LKERLAQARESTPEPADPQAEGFAFPETLPSVREMEDLLLREALRRTRGNRSQAADLVGIARQTMVRRAKELGLEE